MTGFASKFLQQRGGDVRLVHAIQRDRKCWFIIKLDPVKFLEYRNLIGIAGVNLADYGQVLDRGWGEPSSDILKQYAG